MFTFQNYTLISLSTVLHQPGLLHRVSMVMVQPIGSPARYSTSPQSAKAQSSSFQQTWHDFQGDGESSSRGKAGDSQLSYVVFAQKWFRLGQRFL